MSKQACLDFRAQLAGSSELQEQCRNASLSEIVDLASRHGFDFTAEELEALAEEVELSDFELEMVSGGIAAEVGLMGGTQVP